MPKVRPTSPGVRSTYTVWLVTSGGSRPTLAAQIAARSASDAAQIAYTDLKLRATHTLIVADNAGKLSAWEVAARHGVIA